MGNKGTHPEKKIYAMVFDFDGTIADTERIHYEAFRRVLSNFGIELSWEDYMKKYLAYTDEDFFKAVEEEMKSENAEKFSELLKEGKWDIKFLCDAKKKIVEEFIAQGKVSLFRGVKEFIVRMSEKYPLCIVSGALREEINSVLRANGIEGRFKFIVSSEDYSRGKPSTEPFEIALRKFSELGIHVRTEGVVAFEDSLHGVESAYKMGFLVVGVKNYYSEEELRGSGAHMVIDDFSDAERIERELIRIVRNRVFEGERVLLNPVGRHNTFLFKVRVRDKNSELHTHLGIVRSEDLVGKFYGDIVFSSKGKQFYVLFPLLQDRVMKLRRKSAIVYPKDSSFIIFMSGIGPGSRVIETGCGSGGLTIPLAHFVRPDGKVYTYEIRDDFIELVRKNLEENGLSEFVEVRKKDVYKEGFDEKDVDAVFLDLPEPWHCIPFAWESLVPGGVLVSLSPTVNQTEIMAEVLRRNGFTLVDTFEVLVRRFLAREGKSRPAENMISHTAYITIARKVARVRTQEV